MIGRSLVKIMEVKILRVIFLVCYLFLWNVTNCTKGEGGRGEKSRRHLFSLLFPHGNSSNQFEIELVGLFVLHVSD